MKKKLNLSGAFAIVLALLILAVFVPINMIFNYSDKVYDLTPSKKYSLDPKTEEILDATADKQIEVYFLNTLFNLKNEPNALPLYHTFMELDKRDNITLTCFDPNENAELAQSLNPSGVLEVSMNDIFVKCGDVIRQISGNLWQTDSAGIEVYAGENLIAGAIHVVASGNLPTIYFLSGYSDKTLDEDYSSYANSVRADNYAVKELDLSTVDSVPKETVIVCLTAPTRDISVSDREKLSQYIDNGGAVQMFLPPCETSGRFENIEYLLAKFEIGMDYNILNETNTNWMLNNNDNEQDGKYFRVSYPSASEDNSEDLTTAINDLVMNGVYVSGTANTRSFYPLTDSSEMMEKASVMENLPTDMNSGEYTVESIPMGGDESTKELASQKSYEPLIMGYYSYNKQTGAKLFVLGSDEAIDNISIPAVITPDMLPPLFGTRRLSQFSNTWLYNSDVDMGIQNKFNSYDTMHFESGKEASSAIRIFIFVPAVFAVIGVAVWLKRRYA